MTDLPKLTTDFQRALAELRTGRQRAFVTAFLETGNGTASARKAGYGKSARVRAQKLRTTFNVARAIVLGEQIRAAIHA